MPSPESSTADRPQTLDLDAGVIIERLDSWVDGAVRLLPNIVVAIVVFVIFIGLAALAKRLVVGQGARRSRENLGEVLGGFLKWAVMILGFLLAATIVVPSEGFDPQSVLECVAAERCTAPEKTGVKIENSTRAMAKTTAKAAMIDNSQLSPMKSPTTGICRTSGRT